MPESRAPSHISSLATSLVSSLPSSEIEAKPALVPARPAMRVVEVLAPDSWRTPRLNIRPMLLSDREQMIALLSANRAYLSRGLNVQSEGESDAACFERLLASSRAGEATGMCVRRVCTLPQGTIVGMVHLLGLEMGLTPHADVGWWIAQPYAGNGLASEAVAALAEFGLTDRPKGMGLFHIEAAITTANTASQRVAAATGFRKLDGVTTSIQVGETWMTHEIWRRDAQ